MIKIDENNIKRVHSNLYLVRDIDATIEFYKKLGFDVSEADGTARVKLNDFTLAFMEDGSNQNDRTNSLSKGVGVCTYIETEDVDTQYQFIVGNSVTSLSKPESQPWGKREFTVSDVDGYKIVFYSATGG